MGKRSKIFKAAELLLAERGFYGLSMKALAETAGISAGTIYRYFDNKEMLMLELHQHVLLEASQTMFLGWSELQKPKQKYDLLWRNAFNAVLKNPQRLAVIEIISCTPSNEQQTITHIEEQFFLPLLDFYQKGIDEKRFHDWPIPALMTLSFHSATTLAKKSSKQRLQLNENILIQVRDASWDIIQCRASTKNLTTPNY